MLVSQQVSHLFDRTRLPHKVRGEAVAKEVCARAARADSQRRQTPPDDGGNRPAHREGADRRPMAQEDPPFHRPWSAVQHVIRQRATGLRHEGDDAIAAALGSPQVDFAVPPSDVVHFQTPQFAVPHPGRRRE